MTAETLKFLAGAASSPNSNGGQKCVVVSMTNNGCGGGGVGGASAGMDGEHGDNSYTFDDTNDNRMPLKGNGNGCTKPPPKSASQAARKNALLVSFCAIVSICLLILVGAQVIMSCHQRVWTLDTLSRHTRESHTQKNRPHLCTQAAITSTTVAKYTSADRRVWFCAQLLLQCGFVSYIQYVNLCVSE